VFDGKMICSKHAKNNIPHFINFLQNNTKLKFQQFKNRCYNMLYRRDFSQIIFKKKVQKKIVKAEMATK